MKKHLIKYKRELVMTVSLLFIAVISLIAVKIIPGEGKYAEVKIDDKVVAMYELSEDGEYTLNGGTNILVIKDGYAYLTYADCPDKTCVGTGKINRTGQSIICLPNRLSVIIKGEASEDDPEFVS